MNQPRILYWDDEIITAAAWRLCQANGFKHGRGPVERYEQDIANAIMALEQGADDVKAWADADAEAERDDGAGMLLLNPPPPPRAAARQP